MSVSGHNLNLAHSGGLNGATYTDHTGLMGNPLYSDEVGKMCYNPAKNWQLAWYGGTGASGNSPHKILVNPQATPYTSLDMVGVSDYDYGNATNPIVVKIETGTTTDLFVGFNRDTGINSQNDEADNEIVITQAGSNGEGYSQSYLQAHLVEGEQHSITNFASTGQTLTIKAESIDLTSSPGTATVTIALGCTSNAQCDNGIYCDGAETCTGGQCTAGTPILCTDDGLFCNGNEVCDEATNSCISTNPPCAPDDGNFCNGVESCDEVNDTCNVSPPVDCAGQKGATCGGDMTCQPSTGLCIDTGAEDGLCSSGEDCTSCPNDCPSGTSGGARCGNGVCEAGNGENCSTCPQDCNGIQGGKPSNRYCCGSGTSCDDGRCGNDCTDVPVESEPYCCGDGTCTGEETYDSCAIDCPAPAPTPFVSSSPTKAPTPPTGGPVNCPSACSDFPEKNPCNAEAGCSWSNKNKVCGGTPDCLGGSAPPEFCSGSGGFCSGDDDCCGASICKGNSRCS